MTLFSRPRQNNTFKFPAIPPPGNTPEEMMACIRALKEAVELLSGSVGNSRALLTADLYGNTTAGENNFSTPGGTTDIEGYGLLDQANENFREIFDSELVALEAEIANDISDVQTELETALTDLENGTNSQFTVVNGQISTLSSQVSTNTAAITTEAVTRASADSALSASISTVSTSAANNASAITAETLSRTNADNALTLQIDSATSLAGAKGKVFIQSSAPTTTVSYTLSTNDLWIDTLHGNLLKYWTGTAWLAVEDTRIGVAIADISSEALTRAAADSALTSTVDTAVSRIDGIQGSLTESEITSVGNLGALVATTESLQANIDDNDTAINALLTTESATRATADSALSGLVTTAQATANDATASSMMRLLASSTTTGDAVSEFVIQVRANTGSSYASTGLRMQALSNGESRILLNASRFTVLTGAGASTPFTIVGNDIYWGGRLTVTSSDIPAGTLTTAHMPDNSNFQVRTVNIEPGAVDFDQLAPDSVRATTIEGGTITTGHISTSGLSADVITSGFIAAARINAGTITAEKIVANNITKPTFISGSDGARTSSGNVDTAHDLATGSFTVASYTDGTPTSQVLFDFGVYFSQTSPASWDTSTNPTLVLKLLVGTTNPPTTVVKTFNISGQLQASSPAQGYAFIGNFASSYGSTYAPGTYYATLRANQKLPGGPPGPLVSINYTSPFIKILELRR